MKVEDLSSGRKASKEKKKLRVLVNESDEDDHGEAMEEGAASLMRSNSRNQYQPSSRKQTPKTSVLYNIPDLYSAIVEVIKQRDSQFHDTSRHKKFEVESEKEKVFSEASLEKVVDYLVVSEKFDGCWLPVVYEKFDGDTTIEENVETLSEKVPGEAFWEDYPEYDPLSFCLDNDTPDYVLSSQHTLNLDGLWSRVFFDLSIGEHPAGRIVMELFTNSTLITTKNFQALYTGEKGISTVGKPLYCKVLTFPYVVPGYIVYEEDITHENGTVGESIYGPSFSNDNLV
ncbi:hypothetical protein Ddye_008122 [Dipteronia dyeriana]|uniref:PPIase cyclophilin-type domain-containing protein n=1 Tax=Dipteronia dyeriana TaxID=168575 RepID=A0AAD9X972_9ROSI|nr:hypothetical protein Ddye_008122 [Dipteronia dyeriana]